LSWIPHREFNPKLKLAGGAKYEHLKKMGKLKVKTYTPRPAAPTTEAKKETPAAATA
jgi:hypothetical protein